MKDTSCEPDDHRPQTVLVLGSFAASLTNFRGPLLAAMKARGHTVHAAAPGLTKDGATASRLQEMGIEIHDIPLERTGLNPVADLRALLAIRKLCGQIRPDVFLGYTIKPVVWGLLAAWSAGVGRRYALITGLGYAFSNENGGLLSRLARSLYRSALRRAHAALFQNPDDERLFRDSGLLHAGTPSFVMAGSGVDLDRFPPAPLPPADEGVVFLMIARVLREKGVREYAEAARIVKAQCWAARVLLVGPLDTGPDAMTEKQVYELARDDGFEWLGPRQDVRPELAACHVYVLPSYREGLPRTNVEAMATARALVTTDVPGCRETVVEGQNGFLVPARDAQTLADAMLRFCQNPELIEKLGARSRVIAEERFDVRRVNAQMLEAMSLC